MEKQKILNQITELTEQIGRLPKGYISKKPSMVKPTIITSGRRAESSKAGICTMKK